MKLGKYGMFVAPIEVSGDPRTHWTTYHGGFKFWVYRVSMSFK